MTPNPRDGMSRSTILDGVALLLLVAAFVALWNGLTGFSGFVQDDAFISLRYAQNFAAGRGLVFNDGERVEGFTNFSWTLFAALLFKLGFPPLPILRFASCLCAAALVSLVWFHGGGQHWRKNSLAAVLGGLSALILASSTTLALWSVSVLEETLFTLLVFAGFVAFAREYIVTAALFWLAAALSRPEGPLVFGIACLIRSLWLRKEGRSPSKNDWLGVTIFSTGFGFFVLWRLVYYGQVVPNTFFVKGIANLASHTHGLTVFKRFLDFNDNWVLLGLGLLTLGAAFLCRTPSEEPHELPEAAFAALLLISWSYYVVRVGGDILPYFRLNMPMLPFLAIWAPRSVALAAGYTSSGEYRHPVRPEKDSPSGAISGTSPSLNDRWFLGSLLSLRTMGPGVALWERETPLLRWGRFLLGAVLFAFLVFSAKSSVQFTLKHPEFNGSLNCLKICHGGAGEFLETEARKVSPGRVLTVIAQDMGMTPFVAPSVRFVDTIGLTDSQVARALYQFSYTPYLRYLLWADSKNRSRIWEMEMKLRKYLDSQKADFIVINIDTPPQNTQDTRKAIESADEQYFTPLIEQNTFYHGYPATPEFKNHYRFVKGFEFSCEAFLLVYARLP